MIIDTYGYEQMCEWHDDGYDDDSYDIGGDDGDDYSIDVQMLRNDDDDNDNDGWWR